MRHETTFAAFFYGRMSLPERAYEEKKKNERFGRKQNEKREIENITVKVILVRGSYHPL